MSTDIGKLNLCKLYIRQNVVMTRIVYIFVCSMYVICMYRTPINSAPQGYVGSTLERQNTGLNLALYSNLFLLFL